MVAFEFWQIKHSNGQDPEGLLRAIEATQAVIEFDLDGRILAANANFLATVGYSLSEVIGKHHSMFLTPDEVSTPAYLAFWKDLKSGIPKKGEFRRRAKDGRDVYLEAVYNPVLDKAGRPYKVIKVAADVTQRKLKDLDLESKVSAISRSQAMIEFALDGTILTANANFLSVLGYSLEEIVGRHHRMFVDEREQKSPEYEAFWKRLRSGEYISTRFKRIAKGGREVVIQASYNPVFGVDGRPVKIVKFATDITTQAQKDADNLGQLEAISRAQAVIEFALDGTILKANDNFLKTMGYRHDEICGKHHRMFVDEEFAQSDDYRQFWEKLARGEFVAGEFHRHAKGGRTVYIQATYNAILDIDGRPYKIVKFATDVTARRIALNRTTELSHSLQDLSAAVEEMAATGRSIADTMTQTKAAADQANQCVTDADESARQLASAAGQMDGIVELISNITSQINLLALNATIESARAGEAGRGFAVVATEVKNLATQARKATEQISSEISGVRASSSAVVEALNMIRRTVSNVQEQVLFTAGAVEEQSVTSQDMARNMQIASSEAENIVRAA
ncbi:PAS domain-containing methyl-accepting chemotaxis protein [Asticcacaulis sp. DXS10W]|uniref:PAS domain-containing methyl-accepting chemotaxis protein n=1 Tax=Asticcacaulis currens TaxID=2984210 RepID=A0ABT5IBC2_9CAUL|nr:PAS domain-containing methyl-accepting chemotaxis protein [Asticcacaulis currens]MDC7693486.1 PAS domain-containing methyl-accepting chemotaxis protein [Asticcacaulis currens]